MKRTSFVVALAWSLALVAADNRPIGVFDSGTGGLTVLEKMITDDFAHEKFVYLGDQANMPYGDYAAAGKADFLKGLVIKDAEFLLSKNAKIVVIACNTATAYGYDAVADLLAKRGDGTRVIGVVNAGARSAIARLGLATNDAPCAIGVMATPGTIASGVYARTIKAELAKLGVRSDVQVFSRGCAGLADAVEAGSPDAPKIACDNLRALMAEHAAKAPQLPLRAVILGCTHFPFVRGELEAAAPKGVAFIDPAVDTAAECAAALKEQDRRTDRTDALAADVYVSVPAPGLAADKLDGKGGLARAWKYGRADAAQDRSTVPVPLVEATKGDPLKFIPFAHMIPKVKALIAPAANFIKNADLSLMDGMGGTVGWRFRTTPDSMVYAKRKPGGVVELRFQGPSRTYFEQTPCALMNNGHYRLSAEVRTHGLKGAKVQLLMWDNKWIKSWGSPDFPDHTHGAWQKIVWTGRTPTTTDPNGFSIAVAGDGGGGDSENVLEIRNFRLEALDAETAAATKGLPDKNLAPLTLRIVPIDPLLSKVRAKAAAFTFYWPAEPDCGVTNCALSAAVDGGAARTAGIGADGRARIDFGALALGPHRLTVKAVDPQGRTLAENAYTFTARADPEKGPAGKRLNNFVTELVKKPLADGDVRFFRAEAGWTWINFDGANDAATGCLDGCDVPAVRKRAGEDLIEGVRWLLPGWHRLRVAGAERGTLRIHAVKNLAHQICPLEMGPCDFSGKYTFTFPFWKRFVLRGVNIMNYASRAIAHNSDELAYYRERGFGLWGMVHIKWDSPNWLNAEEQWKVLTSEDWRAGYDVSVDESAIGAQRLQHVIFAENCWKMYEMRPNQRVNMYWGDATQNWYDDPKVHTSELMAIANTGDGLGVALPETYAPVMKTQAETDKWIDLFEKQTKAVADVAPAARDMTVFNVSPWIDLGAWSDYPHPEGDSKAMWGHMIHEFATRPGFAANSGLAAGAVGSCEEELRRWLVRLYRYYGLEGGTEDLAAKYGFTWAPGFVKNCDFAEGLAGWTAAPAAEGTLVADRIDKYGTKVQRRKKVPNGTGDSVAQFTSAAAAPNRLSQKLSGLTPGRLYALMFCVANRANIAAPSSNPPEAAFRAQLEGAEELPGLRFVHRTRNTPRGNKKAKNFISLAIHRYVFRATSAAATLVFEDRAADGAAAPDGTKQVLNYVVFRPYYVENDAEADEIAAFMRPAE